MAKAKRASLADIMGAGAIPEAAAVPPDSAPQEQGRAPRRDRPHTTIYLDHAVRNAIKRVAIDVNKRPHDLMLEGIDMMLIKYTGKPAKGHGAT
ncbi:MAG: hypothetical protein JWP57_4631 [Spirosoma sp.]|nr:hypothetical protein [Spirosoma sp.]